MFLATGDLWATQTPSAAGFVVVAVLAAVGIVILLILMRSEHAEPRVDPPAAVDDPLQRELEALDRSRKRILRELEATPGPVREVLAERVEGALDDLDRRVDALLSAACASSQAADVEVLDQQRERIISQVADETDPLARRLLEASLADLDATRDVQIRLSRDARLARLELGRIGTLLDSMPARIQELSARQSLRPDEAGDVEDIARQLELAVETDDEGPMPERRMSA